MEVSGSAQVEQGFEARYQVSSSLLSNFLLFENILFDLQVSISVALMLDIYFDSLRFETNWDMIMLPVCNTEAAPAVI